MRLTLSNILLVAGLLTTFSCAKDNHGPATLTDEELIMQIAASNHQVALEEEDLPVEIRTFNEAQLFETYVEDAFRVNGLGYEMTYGSGDVVYFTLDGRPLLPTRWNDLTRVRHWSLPCARPLARMADLVRPNQLPQAIQDYVAANYPLYEMLRAKVVDNEYYVGLNRGVVLKFDAAGNFIEEVSPLELTRCACNPLERDELPQVVVDFIQSHLPDATFGRACARDSRLIVWLVNDGHRVILIFTRQGVFVFRRN